LIIEPYLAPVEEARAELREKGSRFRAIILPAIDETSALAEIENMAKQHPTASHHCWAWRLGSPARERHSDAKEPTGTAGEPILRALRGAGVSDAVVVVVRWFGGTKLGRGGLSRAYANTTGEVLGVALLEQRAPVVRFELEFPYHQVGAVKRLIHPPQVTLVTADYGEQVTMTVDVQTAAAEELRAALADLGVRVDHPSERGVD
jgi:uncharacterized YigZ family protein